MSVYGYIYIYVYLYIYICLSLYLYTFTIHMHSTSPWTPNYAQMIQISWLLHSPLSKTTWGQWQWWRLARADASPAKPSNNSALRILTPRELLFCGPKDPCYTGSFTLPLEGPCKFLGWHQSISLWMHVDSDLRLRSRLCFKWRLHVHFL